VFCRHRKAVHILFGSKLVGKKEIGFMKEKWREIYTDEQIKKIQEIELENLKVLDEVCQKLGIEFFAYGGTLIGAVRHNGFIPWDDDLDVAMERQDYVKFVNEAYKFLPEGYFLQTPYTDLKTPYLYSKLRRKGTKCIEYIAHKLNIEQGIYIDIYPIDNIPDDDNKYIKQHEKYQKIARTYVLRQCCYPAVEGKSIGRRIKNVIRFILSTMIKSIPQKCFIKRADAIMTKYNDISTIRKGNLSYPKLGNVFYNLFPLKNGRFESVEIKLPGEWDKHLKSRYGDYMKLPRCEERIGHRPYLLDFGKNE